MQCLFLIPLFTALTGWLSIYLLYFLLFRRLLPSRWQSIQQVVITNLQEVIDSNLLASKIQEIDLENEVSPLLDQRLDRLIEQLKKQVPMGEYFLSGAFVERLKARAKEEILQTVPEIKARFIEKADTHFDMKKIIGDQVAVISYSLFEDFIRGFFRKDLMKMQVFGLLTGLVLGIFEAALLFLLF